MKDKEFIELLNLYVDGEISPADAVRVETEISGRPDRRRIYDQYLRIQKGCSLLSGSDLEPAEEAGAPTRNLWGWLFPTTLGLATAAVCALAVVKISSRAPGIPSVAVSPAGAAAQAKADAMLPVFQAKHEAATVFTLGPDESAAQFASLNWIGDIHMAPVSLQGTGALLLSPRSDAKAALVADQRPKGPEDGSEIAAFRFQR